MDLKVIGKDGKAEEVIIVREIDDKCEDVKFSSNTGWGEGYASKEVPKPCKLQLYLLLEKFHQ